MLVAAYVVLRTAGATGEILQIWTAIAVAATALTPVTGLIVVGALAPFTEAQTAAGSLTAMPVLVGALVVSVLVRAGRAGGWRGIGPPRDAASAATWIAAALAAGTALSIVTTLARLGSGPGVAAAQLWVVGIGGGLVLSLVVAWLARTGHIEGLAVVTASAAVAALISLVDFLLDGAVVRSSFGWLLRPESSYLRLTGVLPAPNPAAALYLIPACLIVAWALFAARTSLSGRALRLLALAGAGLTVLAAALTLSRSAAMAVAGVAVIFAWRIRRMAGIVVGIAAALAATVALPHLNAARDDGGAGQVGQALALADAQRLDAWRAAIRMWWDAPLTGQGLRSFEWLHARFGDPVSAAPHNEWLRAFAEGGTVVGLLAVAFVVTVIAALARERSWLGTGILGAFVVFVVVATFNNPLLYIQVAVPVFIVVGTGLGLASGAPRTLAT